MTICHPHQPGLRVLLLGRYAGLWPASAEPMQFPAHWGQPPAMQTVDLRPLPGDYGEGSSTLAQWTQANLDKDASTPDKGPRQPDGSGAVAITGELRQWHKVTLTLDGPFAHERDTAPNPFNDYAMAVVFTHESGEAGTKWRAHLSPDKPGRWTYLVSFARGRQVAVGDARGEAVEPFDGRSGSFAIGPTDKTGRDLRAQARLRYVSRHHLQSAGSREYFLKAGADAPETLLAYADFDGTRPGRKREARTGEAAPTQSLHRYAPHVADWKVGDPPGEPGADRLVVVRK